LACNTGFRAGKFYARTPFEQLEPGGRTLQFPCLAL